MWTKLDDGFPDHPKVTACGPLAAWLYVCGLCYTNRLLTDGFIPAGQIRRLADVPDAEGLAEKLCDVGLWDHAENGYRIHDFHDFNMTADELRERRAQISAARSEAGKKGMAKRWGDNKITKGITGEITNHPRRDAAAELFDDSETAHPCSTPRTDNKITNPITNGYQNNNKGDNKPAEMDNKITKGITPLPTTHIPLDSISSVEEIESTRAQATQPVPKPQRAKSQKTPLPPTFEISEEMLEWQRDTLPGLRDVYAATEEWLDYCRREGARFIDWKAAWRNGMRKALEFQNNRKAVNGNGQGKSRIHQRTDENLEALFRAADTIGSSDPARLYPGPSSRS